MRWSVTKANPVDVAGNLLVLPVFAGKKKARLEPVLELVGKGHPGLVRSVKAAGFLGKAQQLLPVASGACKGGWLLLVGLGERDALSLDGIRRAAGAAASRARGMDARTCVVGLLGAGLAGYDQQTVARSWTEGAELALSPTGELKTGGEDGAADPDTKNPRTWKLVAADAAGQRALRAGTTEGQDYAAGCLLSRRLVNLPANHLTPRMFADEARRVARAEGMRCRVLGPAQLARQKMGGILGVGGGSHEDPQLIILESGPGGRKKVPTIGLVGKGLTFDAGGISLKPAAKMDEMKSDMGGAAAVLGAAVIARRRRLPVRLLVLIPAAENLPGGGAVKPGDVLTMASGKTIEVLNTDAEGRLVLADALHYACGRKPDFLIDAATLTGACAIALGKHFAGLMSTSSELIDTLIQAGGETGERVWHLPLIDEHKKSIAGTWSDLKNLGPRYGGARSAAALLWEFGDEDIPWAHLDIAGTAWADSAGPLGPKGGTGFGARLLARAVELLVS